MSTWIVFQRAVNVGGRKYPMAELRQMLTEAGYGDVATHIQTGNIRLTSPLRSQARLEKDLEALFEADRGFDVGTVAMAPAELGAVAAEADEVVAELGAPEFGHYVELLRSPPSAEATAVIEEPRHPGQRAVVRGRAVHLLFDLPFHQAKPPSAAVKRALGVSTNRNVTVVRALVQKWC
ncbi:DUF1697 domain-containing protein [Nocardioides terrisoli]|uniref:DUF1697 domain-containing protein n=1 Tax=Nocardioides terrisoli TaxID=3388267 RepID=UPI00287BA4E1|nr:DUF1697 domain-containing protein [Nocardioides marmorisolisilvae]